MNSLQLRHVQQSSHKLLLQDGHTAFVHTHFDLHIISYLFLRYHSPKNTKNHRQTTDHFFFFFRRGPDRESAIKPQKMFDRKSHQVLLTRHSRQQVPEIDGQITARKFQRRTDRKPTNKFHRRPEIQPTRKTVPEGTRLTTSHQAEDKTKHTVSHQIPQKIILLVCNPIKRK